MRVKKTKEKETTNSEKYYNLCSSLSAIGINKKSKTELYSLSGSNNRMTELQAIAGISQLKRLDSFVEHSKLVFSKSQRTYYTHTGGF